MNEPKFTHYGLSNGQRQAHEVATGMAEFGSIASRAGVSYYWRGNEVPLDLLESLQLVTFELRQSIYDARMKADALAEHDSSAS